MHEWGARGGNDRKWKGNKSVNDKNELYGKIKNIFI